MGGELKLRVPSSGLIENWPRSAISAASRTSVTSAVTKGIADPRPWIRRFGVRGHELHHSVRAVLLVPYTDAVLGFCPVAARSLTSVMFTMTSTELLPLSPDGSRAVMVTRYTRLSSGRSNSRSGAVLETQLALFLFVGIEGVVTVSGRRTVGWSTLPTITKYSASAPLRL